ncbi:MAG TPA: sulfite exporter TauE/SafE family protein, partial [Candidatus Aminicenantes bacterium]|nr:sulfite exporter TauE/SafE family protein [Candidatus Aminicenantes bacterium]
SNVAALVGFLGAGKVVIALGVPAALAGIAGNLLGARLVRWRGNRLIRPLILVALFFLLVKVVFDLLRQG